MLKRDRIGGIIFAIFGIIVTILAMEIRMPANLNEPGPRIFPYISGIGMAICGIGMAITAKKDDGEPYLTRDGWKKLALAGGIMFIYYLALEYIGFLIATPIFTFTIVLVLADGKKLNKITTAVVALATTGGLYYVFQILFSIFLPVGKLFK